MIYLPSKMIFPGTCFLSIYCIWYYLTLNIILCWIISSISSKNMGLLRTEILVDFVHCYNSSTCTYLKIILSEWMNEYSRVFLWLLVILSFFYNELSVTLSCLWIMTTSACSEQWMESSLSHDMMSYEPSVRSVS